RHPKIAAYAEEDEPFPRLGHPEVRRVHDPGLDLVRASQLKVFLHLLQHTHLRHTRNVLHDKGRGPKLINRLDELSVQRVPGVIDQPGVVTDLRESLAGWPTHHHVYPATS